MNRLDHELGEPNTDSPLHGLSSLLRRLPQEDFSAIQDLLFARRADYLRSDSTEPNIYRLYNVMKEELVNALVERARKRKTDAKRHEG